MFKCQKVIHCAMKENIAYIYLGLEITVILFIIYMQFEKERSESYWCNYLRTNFERRPFVTNLTVRTVGNVNNKFYYFVHYGNLRSFRHAFEKHLYVFTAPGAVRVIANVNAENHILYTHYARVIYIY